MRINLSFSISDYTIYSDIENSIMLSPREMAILLSIAVFLSDRQLWETMSDTEWDDFSSDIAVILGKLQND